MTPEQTVDIQAKTKRFIELKEQEKILKKELDELNAFFKTNGVEGAEYEGFHLNLGITTTPNLTKDPKTIHNLKLEYPHFLEFGKDFLTYVKNQPELHQYLEFKESVTLTIKKPNDDRSVTGATSSKGDELF